MEVVFLKIERTRQGNVFEIPVGCVRFQFRNKEIANDETFYVHLDDKGNLYALNINIRCMVFEGDSGKGEPIEWSVFGIISNESFELKFKRELQISHRSEREWVALEIKKEVQGNGLQAVV